jgi:hypothetical protein
MIANLRTERRFRLIAVSVAVIALVQAMMVTPTWACERDHDSVSAAASASNAPTQHPSGDSDCEKSSSQSPMQHNDCQTACISMSGCGAPSLVSGQAVVGLSLRESGNPLTLVIAYASRSLAPDRPPPRS